MEDRYAQIKKGTKNQLLSSKIKWFKKPLYQF